MKKIFLSAIAFFIFLVNNSNSQSFYVKPGGGYGLGTNTSIISIIFDTTNIEGHYGSYGEGIVPSIGLGYMFNSNIGIEINGAYLIGRRFEHEHTSGGVTETHKQWGEGILISPALMIQAQVKNVTPYAKFGGTLGLVKVKEEEIESGTGARTGTDIHEESGSIALGINGALGVKFKAGSMLDIFAELFGQGMNYAPEKRENTETFSGEELDETINYKEEFPQNAANTELTPRHPFSSFGINVGIVLKFGKTSKAKK